MARGISLLKRSLDLALAPLGLEIRRKSGALWERGSMRGMLEHARKLGVAPATVLDVGAASGTPQLLNTFPQARHFLFEALTEFQPALEQLKAARPTLDYLLAAVAAQPGEITINVHPDLFGSSMYLEAEDSNVNGTPRQVPTVTLDTVCAQRQLPGPYLLKLDVQGAELDVLQGGVNTLHQTEYVVIEAVLFRYFVGGKQLDDIVTFMREAGFALYDICDPLYRPLDGALSQVDLAFVPEGSRLRQHHFYATRQQREAQNRRIQRSQPARPGEG